MKSRGRNITNIGKITNGLEDAMVAEEDKSENETYFILSLISGLLINEIGELKNILLHR